MVAVGYILLALNSVLFGVNLMFALSGNWLSAAFLLVNAAGIWFSLNIISSAKEVRRLQSELDELYKPRF